tara:strand:- start:150687 stop:151340 length:654 start_codon:yes stop_codon:yes gene_type:complete
MKKNIEMEFNMKSFLLILLSLISFSSIASVEKYEEKARSGDSESQYRLGLAYEFGRSVEQDVYTAEYWYDKADRQGHLKASARLGYLDYEAENYSSAKRYFAKGLKKGKEVYFSMLYYGKILRLEGDEIKGLALIKIAAQNGVPQAMSEWAYYNGYEASKKNYYSAYVYSKMAKVKKYSGEKDYTSYYKSKLTGNQISSGDRTATRMLKEFEAKKSK